MKGPHKDTCVYRLEYFIHRNKTIFPRSYNSVFTANWRFIVFMKHIRFHKLKRYKTFLAPTSLDFGYV